MCELCITKQLALIDMIEKQLKDPNYSKEDVVVSFMLLKSVLILQQTVEQQQLSSVVVQPLTPVPLV